MVLRMLTCFRRHVEEGGHIDGYMIWIVVYGCASLLSIIDPRLIKNDKFRIEISIVVHTCYDNMTHQQ